MKGVFQYEKIVKLVSVLLSVCMAVAVVGFSASAETTNPITKRALILSAPYDYGAISPTTVNGMVAMFQSNGITTTTYINNTRTTLALENAISQALSSADVEKQLLHL